jgi:hypothetical protein
LWIRRPNEHVAVNVRIECDLCASPVKKLDLPRHIRDLSAVI